jgi:hypothetical protein
MIFFQALNFFHNKQPFNAIDFGAGFGGLLAAGGFGVAAKDKAVKVPGSASVSATIQGHRENVVSG